MGWVCLEWVFHWSLGWVSCGKGFSLGGFVVVGFVFGEIFMRLVYKETDCPEWFCCLVGLSWDCIVYSGLIIGWICLKWVVPGWVCFCVGLSKKGLSLHRKDSLV